MRTGESEELVGIMRLLSVTLPASASEPPWFAVMIGLEQESIASMGYTLGGVMWQRDDVPIAGSGFENARAFGLEATIDGNDTPQEAHFLVFEKGEEKYIITLLTPGREVESGVFYKRNTKDFGILIRGLKTPMQ